MGFFRLMYRRKHILFFLLCATTCWLLYHIFYFSSGKCFGFYIFLCLHVYRNFLCDSWPRPQCNGVRSWALGCPHLPGLCGSVLMITIQGLLEMLLHFMDIRWYCALTHTCTDIHCTCSSWICIFDNQNILYILLQVKPFIIVWFMIKGLLYWINMIKILKKKYNASSFCQGFFFSSP